MGLVKNFLLTMSHWKKSLLTFLFKLKYKICKQWDLLNENSTMSHWSKKFPLRILLYIYIFYVSSGLVELKKFNYVPLAHSSLQYIPYLSYFHMCKQWDLLKLPFNYVPLAHSTSLHTNILHLQDM